MANYKVLDADGHVRESVAGMREFLEPRWHRRNLFPNDEWDRDLHGKLGQKPEDRKINWPLWTKMALTSWFFIRRQVCT